MDGLGRHHRPVDESVKFGRVASWSCVDLDQVRSPVRVEKNVVAKEPVGVVAGLDLLNNLTFVSQLKFHFYFIQLGVEVGSHRFEVVELLHVLSVPYEGGEPAQDALHNNVLNLKTRKQSERTDCYLFPNLWNSEAAINWGFLPL